MGLIQEFEYLSLRYRDGHLEALDQRLLPHVEKWLPADTPEQTWHLIKELAVRGAPLIGVASALSIAVLATRGTSVVANDVRYLVVSPTLVISVSPCRCHCLAAHSRCV